MQINFNNVPVTKRERLNVTYPSMANYHLQLLSTTMAIRLKFVSRISS